MQLLRCFHDRSRFLCLKIYLGALTDSKSCSHLPHPSYCSVLLQLCYQTSSSCRERHFTLSSWPVSKLLYSSHPCFAFMQNLWCFLFSSFHLQADEFIWSYLYRDDHLPIYILFASEGIVRQIIHLLKAPDVDVALCCLEVLQLLSSEPRTRVHRVFADLGLHDILDEIQVRRSVDTILISYDIQDFLLWNSYWIVLFSMGLVTQK